MDKPDFKKTYLGRSLFYLIGFILVSTYILFSDISFGPVPKWVVIIFVFISLLYTSLKWGGVTHLFERARYKDSLNKKK